MSGRAAWPLVLLVAACSGCASAPASVRFAKGLEVMCKHCNCLMPAGDEPGAMCPICDCGYTVHECERGR